VLLKRVIFGCQTAVVCSFWHTLGVGVAVSGWFEAILGGLGLRILPAKHDVAKFPFEFLLQSFEAGVHEALGPICHPVRLSHIGDQNGFGFPSGLVLCEERGFEFHEFFFAFGFVTQKNPLRRIARPWMVRLLEEAVRPASVFAPVECCALERFISARCSGVRSLLVNI